MTTFRRWLISGADPPSMVVERVSGEAPPVYFLGPSWAMDKPAVLNALDSELKRRDSWQGKKYEALAQENNES